MFTDHGVGGAELSMLFALWSVTAFVAEIPSGTLADVVSRRLLLAASSLLCAVAFATWLVWPSTAGFATGFVVWGVAGALQSGTFEALVYDALDERGAADRYAAVSGWAQAGSMAGVLVATAAAGPLHALGGYPVVGWVSVAVAAANAALAVAFPSTTRARRPVAVRSLDRVFGAGVRQIARRRGVRRRVLLTAALGAFLVYDEYFPVVAHEHGAPTAQVPLLVALTVVGQMIGAGTAGWTAYATPRTAAAALVAAAVLLATGALLGGYAGFALLGAGYGIVHNAWIVAEARLQDVIDGDSRATVASVTGFGTEMLSVGVYATFAAGSVAVSTTVLVALLAAPLPATALLAARRPTRG
nr:MFS transporter [Rhodococcus sp. HNM0569]